MEDTNELRIRSLLRHLRPVPFGIGVMLGSVSWVPALGGNWAASWLLGCAMVGYGVVAWAFGGLDG